VTIREIDEMPGVFISPGPFSMGSSPDLLKRAVQVCDRTRGDCDPTDFDVEAPAHRVSIEGFWIDLHEVTNWQFERFVEETGHRTLAEERGFGHVFEGNEWIRVEGADWRHPGGPGTGIRDKADHPVVQVSWMDAEAYCAWTGGRLPTEAEWEKAASGMEERMFPWGNEVADCERADFLATGERGCEGDTAPVESRPAGRTPIGVAGLAGNAREWVADWFAPDYYRHSPELNPRGPELGEQRSIRGGSWMTDGLDLRVAARGHGLPQISTPDIGFRCVLDAR
jgi:formylglycine-generating enzyme required for sulfatase activity